MTQISDAAMISAPPLSDTDTAAGWSAALQLTFAHDGATTRLHRVGGHGPLYVQKPFYPEPDVCHAYLLHPPGGVAGGDLLHTGIDVTSNAHALLTTPAATKHLRSRGPRSKTTLHITVADHAVVEYLPQETIVFNGANATSQTTIDLRDNAHMISWETVCLGRPANGEVLQAGTLAQTLRINRWCARRQRLLPVLIDQQRWQGGGTELSAAWGLHNHPVLGTLFAAPADVDMLALLRARSDVAVACTLVNGVLIGRLRGPSTEMVSERLQALWQALRPLLLQRTAVAPNIWHT